MRGWKAKKLKEKGKANNQVEKKTKPRNKQKKNQR
jgi:hypothetical protein